MTEFRRHQPDDAVVSESSTPGSGRAERTSRTAITVGTTKSRAKTRVSSNATITDIRGSPAAVGTRLAGHAVPGCRKDCQPLRRDRFSTGAARSVATRVDAGERCLGVLELLPGRKEQARRHLAPVATESVGVRLIGGRAVQVVGQFDDVCELPAPLLLEHAAVL